LATPESGHIISKLFVGAFIILASVITYIYICDRFEWDASVLPNKLWKGGEIVATKGGLIIGWVWGKSTKVGNDFFVWTSNKLVDWKWISSKDEANITSLEVEELIDINIKPEDLIVKISDNLEEKKNWFKCNRWKFR